MTAASTSRRSNVRAAFIGGLAGTFIVAAAVAAMPSDKAKPTEPSSVAGRRAAAVQEARETTTTTLPEPSTTTTVAVVTTTTVQRTLEERVARLENPPTTTTTYWQQNPDEAKPQVRTVGDAPTTTSSTLPPVAVCFEKTC